MKKAADKAAADFVSKHKKDDKAVVVKQEIKKIVGAPKAKPVPKAPPKPVNPCPASFPYALEWKRSGAYWCYRESNGNQGKGPVCHYSGSTPAPNGGQWGKNQQACPKANGDYVGCFKDEKSRDLPVSKGDGKSPATCKALCKGYSYYALQWKQQCRCGNSYGKYGATSGCKCGT